MKKRFLSMFLALALCLGLCAAPAFADIVFENHDGYAYPVTGGNIYFDKEAGEIVGADEGVTAANIPAVIDGVPVTAIGTGAFGYSPNLESVTIPNGVTDINYLAFARLEKLTSIDIPASVTYIDMDAFSDGTHLEAINVDAKNDTYASIDGILFNKELTEIQIYPSYKKDSTYVIPNGVTTISYAFSGCVNLASLTIPSSVKEIYDGFWGCPNLTAFNVDAKNTVYASVDGVLFNKGLTTVVRYPEGKQNSSYTLPDSVTEIDSYAFYNCANLTSVTIPGSVTTIGREAFTYCINLTSINIPDSVKSVASAFTNCSSLKSVRLPSTITEIAASMFYGTSLSSVVIPSGVTAIRASAFAECSELTTVTIPASVTAIDKSAFYECNSLTDIYYEGTKAQWDAIDKNGYSFFFGDGNFKAIENAAIHYNSPMPDPIPAFTDVPDWCSAAVDWAVDQGVTTGTTANKFSPSTQCSQAMILTFLWRAAGEPASSAALPVDITGKNIAYAETALRWAAEKGMVGPALDPTGACTRADAVTYIWKAFGSQSAAASSFSDVSASASYAAAVNWAVANGIVEGYTDGNFHPEVACNRGVIVTMLHRAYVESARLG